MTQKEKILRHLNLYGSINPLQALGQYSIMRLASRISDLKKQGYPITKKIINSTNKFGEAVHYAEYELTKRM